MSNYPRYELMDSVWEVNFMLSCERENVEAKLVHCETHEEVTEFLESQDVIDRKLEGVVEMFFKLPATKTLIIWKDENTVFLF